MHGRGVVSLFVLFLYSSAFSTEKQTPETPIAAQGTKSVKKGYQLHLCSVEYNR